MRNYLSIFLIFLIDKFLSLVLIILLFPILLIIFFILFFFNNKNIFYISERIGHKNKKFKLIKFITMKKGGKDEITTIGKFLRRTSLDELPQLINVIIGNMSLVGPRPYPKNILEQIDDKKLLLRHQIKPGLTGYSQINFKGNKRSLEEKIIYDLYYVKNYNLIFYLKIIIKTPLILIKRYFLNPTGKSL